MADLDTREAVRRSMVIGVIVALGLIVTGLVGARMDVAWKQLAWTGLGSSLVAVFMGIVSLLTALLGQHWPSPVKWTIDALLAVLLALNVGLLAKLVRERRRAE